MKLKEYLKLKKLTYDQFASMVGLSRSTISNYINGFRKPTAKNALTIEQFTRKIVTVRDLIED